MGTNALSTSIEYKCPEYKYEYKSISWSMHTYEYKIYEHKYEYKSMNTSMGTVPWVQVWVQI